MRTDLEKATRRAEEYGQRRTLQLEDILGWGADGIVFSTDRGSAVKAFLRSSLYTNERNVYQRIQERGLSIAAGFAVPRLIGFHDELFVVEMGLVAPPFVVDFAGAYLDRRPPFSEEEWAEWEADRRELFEDDWDLIPPILSAFRAIGVYLNDVKPGNVTVR